MRRISAIHTFEDQDFLRGISRASLAVLLLGVLIAAGWFAGVTALGASLDIKLVPFELPVALGGLGARLLGVDEPASGMATMPAWWLSLAVAMMVSLVVHELVHGFFFKQFAPAGSRVTFGANLKMGMLYASAEGIVYSRRQYIVIAIAPSIVVTLLLVAVGIGLRWPLWTIIAATAHLSGCTGDWGYIRAIRRDPRITHCEDTSWGVQFYGDDVSVAAEEGNAGLEVMPVSAGGEAETADGGPTDVVVVAGVPRESDTPVGAGFTVVDGGKRA